MAIKTKDACSKELQGYNKIVGRLIMNSIFYSVNNIRRRADMWDAKPSWNEQYDFNQQAGKTQRVDV